MEWEPPLWFVGKYRWLAHFMTLDILAGLFWGAMSGEWKGASPPGLSLQLDGGRGSA